MMFDVLTFLSCHLFLSAHAFQLSSRNSARAFQINLSSNDNDSFQASLLARITSLKKEQQAQSPSRTKTDERFVTIFNKNTSSEGIHTLEVDSSNSLLAFMSYEDCLRFCLQLSSQGFFDPAPKKVTLKELERFVAGANTGANTGANMAMVDVPEGTRLQPPGSNVEYLNFDPKGDPPSSPLPPSLEDRRNLSEVAAKLELTFNDPPPSLILPGSTADGSWTPSLEAAVRRQVVSAMDNYPPGESGALLSALVSATASGVAGAERSLSKLASLARQIEALEAEAEAAAGAAAAGGRPEALLEDDARELRSQIRMWAKDGEKYLEGSWLNFLNKLGDNDV